MRSVTAVAAVGLALVAAAPAAPVGEEEVPTRDCRSRGDPSDGRPMRFVRPEYDVVVGPVSFGGLRPAGAHSAVAVRPDGRLAVKALAKVLWGRAVTVRVSEADREALALEYVRQQPTAAVRFEPCPPGTLMFGRNGRLRRVTGFPGGFSFTRRGCYELEVQVERGRSYRRTISLGAGRC